MQRFDRRRFLKGLTAGVLGAVPWARALGATLAHGPGPVVRHLIFLYLDGGPSHLDTFDPKPGTRAGGPFKAIRTAIPGVSFSEHLPGLAERAGKLVVLRSVGSREGSHERARFLLHTGFSPVPGTGFPCLGSTLARELAPPELPLPGYICLGGTGEGAGLHGPDLEPFVIRNLATGRIPHLAPPAGVRSSTVAGRLALQAALDAGFGERVDAALAAKHQGLMTRAHRLMTTPLAASFDWKQEPESVQRAYGTSPFGRHCLVARRLVEAGVPAVEVELSGWDSHRDNFSTHAALMAQLDPALSRLLDDLEERELLEKTVVLVGGEFGRSPSINADEGRDHHPGGFSLVMAGGSLARGMVVGATDERGDRPRGKAIGIPDVLATLFHVLGVDPGKTLMAGDRPITLGNGGRILKEMLEE